MKVKSPALSVCAVLLTMSAAFAQDAAAPILNHSFEENDSGWTGVGQDAGVSVTYEPSLVKTGKGALKFSYAVKKGEFNMLMLPTPNGALGKAKAIKFWIKSDHSAPCAFVLQEKGGGRYSSFFSVPKGQWQQVELHTSDFVLDEGDDAPKDPDGKLDMDQVEGAGIADIGQFFVQGDDTIAAVFGVFQGDRVLALDDFSVTVDNLPATTGLKDGEGTLDTFARPQITWIGTGDIQMTKAVGKPLEGSGLQIKYHQAPMKITGFGKGIRRPNLAAASKITFSIASENPVKLIVQLEEKGGGKYNTTFDVPGKSVRTDLTVRLADLQPAQDSKDSNNHLDLDQVTQIYFLDVSGLTGSADADNTIWLNNIKASRDK